MMMSFNDGEEEVKVRFWKR